MVELIEGCTICPLCLCGSLARFAAGDETTAQAVVGELTLQIYAALKRWRAQLRHERADHTLQSTALVNEAYRTHVRGDRLTPRDRGHSSVWQRASCGTCWSITRARRAVKRGGDVQRHPCLDRTLTGYADHASRQFSGREADATEAAVAQEMISLHSTGPCNGCRH